MTPPRSNSHSSQSRAYAEARKCADLRAGQWPPRSPRRTGSQVLPGSLGSRGPKRCGSVSRPCGGLTLDTDIVDAESEETTTSSPEPSVEFPSPTTQPCAAAPSLQKRNPLQQKRRSQSKEPLPEDQLGFACREAPASPTNGSKCQSAGPSPLVSRRCSVLRSDSNASSPQKGAVPLAPTPRKSTTTARRQSGGTSMTPPSNPQALKPPSSEDILWEDRRRSSGGTTSTTASTSDFLSLELAPDGHASGNQQQHHQPQHGLGALQPEGRDQVLSQWMDGPGQSKPPTAQQRNRSSSTGSTTGPRGSVVKRDVVFEEAAHRDGDQSQRRLADMITSLRTSMVGKSSARGKASAEIPRLEWSSLSIKARLALQQWFSGQIGGRHCLMLLEYDAAIAFFISPLDDDEVQASDLRGSVVLGALSGLSSEGRGGWDNGWLHAEVFAKNPSQVLEDAMRCALDDSSFALAREVSSPASRRRSSADTVTTLSTDRSSFSADQVNLTLRRRAMQAQGDGMRSLLGKKRGAGPRCSEEYMRAQVWLELMRMHVEGPSPEQLAQESQQIGRGSLKDGSANRRSSSMGRANSAPSPTNTTLWDDQKVRIEIRKKEADIEAESKSMTLDALRNQNRSIEAYLMRLVRQRDQLKQIAKLAEECDSYLMLGLDGPNATDDEIKRAYHTLARREHPDKAGVNNKERFQEIQQAYSAVTKRRKSLVCPPKGSTDLGQDAPNPRSSARMSRASSGSFCAEEDEPSKLIREVASQAELARDAAESITAFAHDAFAMRAKGMEARGMQKRAALRELQALTLKSLLKLRHGAFHLRAINDSAQAVAECAQQALIDYGEWAETAMAGAGLKERAEVMQQVGLSCVATAEQLEKMSENDEATLQKIERVTCEVDMSAGCRMLSDSLLRTATVVRCAADEAIGAATTSLELGCSLAVLDRQQRQDRAEKEAEKQAQQFDEEIPRPGQGKRTDLATQTEAQAEEAEKRKSEGENDKDDDSKSDKDNKDDADSPEKNTFAGTGGTREEVKCRQAALRMRHLQCLGSLNEEVLTLQKKLKELMERSEGLMPSVATAQKGSVFDLVAQLLQYSLTEAAKLASDAAMPSRQVLEKCFAFALAIEHSSSVALPAEVKTQALKLAAIIDCDLLCQIIEGPLKRRLLSLEKNRPASLRDKERCQQLHFDFSEFIRDPQKQSAIRGGSNGSVLGRGSGNPVPGGGGQAWAEAVHGLCARVVDGLRKPLQGGESKGVGEGGSDPFVSGVFY